MKYNRLLWNGYFKSDQGQIQAYSEDTGDAKIADYQELTNQEESDLIEIVDDCEGQGSKNVKKWPPLLPDLSAPMDWK